MFHTPAHKNIQHPAGQHDFHAFADDTPVTPEEEEAWRALEERSIRREVDGNMTFERVRILREVR